MTEEENLKRLKRHSDKLIKEFSKERKEEEARRRKESERQYWEWYNDNIDRTPLDYQGYDGGKEGND